MNHCKKILSLAVLVIASVASVEAATLKIATLASLGLLGQPVVAALLAWWLLAEPMSPVQMTGALGVLAGIGLASRAPQPSPR